MTEKDGRDDIDRLNDAMYEVMSRPLSVDELNGLSKELPHRRSISPYVSTLEVVKDRSRIIIPIFGVKGEF